MRTVIFTLPMSTPNASQVCEGMNNKEFNTVSDFIATLLQYELAEEEDIVIFEMDEYVFEFNTSTVADDSLKVASTYMGYIKVKEF